MEKAVFVIGNGESRKGFDLNRIIPYGIIIGCNAIYREFTPNYLIAVDSKMIDEIIWAGYAKKNYNKHNYVIVPNFQGIIRYPEGIICEPRLRLGWSAGPTAVKYATILDDGKDIFMLGFDLYGIDGKHNNIYKGTENYRGADEKETNYGNWIFQLTIVFREHPDKKFYRVGRENDPMPGKWKAFENIKFISYDEMWRRIKWQN